jgi:hypothetical protein
MFVFKSWRRKKNWRQRNVAETFGQQQRGRVVTCFLRGGLDGYYGHRAPPRERRGPVGRHAVRLATAGDRSCFKQWQREEKWRSQN